jgi:transglutaminase-like putative cysteine protease
MILVGGPAETRGSARAPKAAEAAPIDRYFELSVLGLVLSGYLAVLGSGYLDAPTAVFTALGLLLRGLMVTGAIRLRVPRLTTVAVALAYIAFYPADIFLLSRNFIAATVHLAFFLAVVKVLTAHATRDYVFLGVVGFLEILAASVLSASLTFFVFLVLFLVFAVATFASSEIRRSMRKPHNLARSGVRRLQWRLAALTVAMSAGILVLTAGLFFLLPRTAQAAFRHLAPQRYHLLGFSNEMALDEIGEIQKLQTAVMHVRISGGRGAAGLKWRGMSLAEFDGRRWFNRAEPGRPLRVNQGLLQLADPYQQWRPGLRIQYEVQLSAMASDVIFFAGRPEAVLINSPLVIETAGDSFRLASANTEGLRYGAYSYLEDSTTPRDAPPKAPLPLRLAYLELPPLDPRIPALARRVTEGALTDERRARALELYLQTSYRYTTRLPQRQVADPLAHFLFERRAGHCEYFASAMAVMLRSLDIPSRVVTGFQGGIYNPVSGWYVVRASDAHSWVEAYLPRRGWTTLDPTPPAADRSTASLWTRFGFYLDAADTFWQEWVLNYNLDRQLILATRMEDSGRTFGAEWVYRLRTGARRWRAAAVAWGRRYGLAALAAVLLALAVWLAGPRVWGWWRTLSRVRQVQRGAASSRDATLIYLRMLRLLKRRGFEKPAWITPSEFARMLPASPAAALVASFTTAYNGLRFGSDPAAAGRMMALLEQIERESIWATSLQR